MRIRLITAALAAATLAACADVPVSPRLQPVAARATKAPSTMRVSGRALGALLPPDRVENEQTDTFRPLAGVRVTLYQPVDRDGHWRVETVAVATTDADGAYVFEDVPAGAYVVVLNASPRQAFGQALTNVPAGSSHVTADLRVWYRPIALVSGAF